MELQNAINRFIQFLDHPPGEGRDEVLLRLSDQILYWIERTPEQFDEHDHPDAPEHDYERKRAELSARFSEYGYYNLPAVVTEDIVVTGVIVGDAVDDLVDLYHTFRDFLWRCGNTSEQDAVWHLKCPERFHWEEHLRNLQYYLFHRIGEQKFSHPAQREDK